MLLGGISYDGLGSKAKMEGYWEVKEKIDPANGFLLNTLVVER